MTIKEYNLKIEKMQKKIKNLESLKKFQLKNGSKEKLTGGIGGPAYTPPNYGQATSGCYLWETTSCNEDFIFTNGTYYGWGGCNGDN
ncbi:hypothetical protein [Chryseobacterium hagamense]|uniref:Uncharacterized protein n=1 Tax=Chryseobacterium hagamense TaxID=395935 RepID=A0A511YMI5_9FLAO|nr:hypothetical protein [Chryseobacterium hagamense]GEN76398.1 hypothetical protein CHA01nite_21380 [Chryseobacterium hagamense]